MFFKKKEETDYKNRISNLKLLIAARDNFIAQQEMTIECLKEVINSLEEENQSLREVAYKTAKISRKSAVKETTTDKKVTKKTAAKKTTKK